MRLVILSEVLERLEPLEQQAVDLIYVQRRTADDAAHTLQVERKALAAALAAAYQRIAQWALDDDVPPATTSALEHRRRRQPPVDYRAAIESADQ